MARAQLIGYHMIGGTKRVAVVFPLETPDETLVQTIKQLHSQTGVVATRGIGHYHGPMNGQSKIVWVRLQTFEDAQQAACELHTLTEPEWPVTVAHLRAKLSLCRCNQVNTDLTLRFLVPPEDEEGFELHYRARLGRLSREELHGDCQPPYDHLRDVLKATFYGLGAHIAYIWIEAEPEVQACNHR